MTSAEIEARLIALIERAEYAGRQDGISKATRSQKRSDLAREMADLSSRMVRLDAHSVAVDLAAEFDRQVSR